MEVADSLWGSWSFYVHRVETKSGLSGYQLFRVVVSCRDDSVTAISQSEQVIKKQKNQGVITILTLQQVKDMFLVGSNPLCQINEWYLAKPGEQTIATDGKLKTHILDQSDITGNLKILTDYTNYAWWNE